jgi:hypothetical protein
MAVLGRPHVDADTLSHAVVDRSRLTPHCVKRRGLGMTTATQDGSAPEGPRRSRWPIAIGVVLVVVVALIGILALAVFLALRGNDAAAEAQEATSVDMATLPQTIPFTTLAGHVVVDAVADGSGETLAFMLDSGAPVLYSDEVAAGYGGDPVGQIKTVAVDGTITEEDVVTIESLAMGDAVFHDVAGAVGWVDEDNPLSCVTEVGLLGANLMKNAVWQIDYDAQQVTIAPSLEGLEHIDGAIALEFTSRTPQSPSPLVEIPVGDSTLTFLVDTGSDGGLTLNPADLEALGLSVDAAAPTISSVGAGAAGTFTADIAFVDIPLALGGSEVSYPVATTTTLAEGQGNIGNGFLSAFVTTIDWPGGMIYLDPVTADGSIAPPPEPAVAGIGWNGERIVVSSVVAGSEADQAGLELGTVVSSIGGISYENPTRDDFCALLTAEPPADGIPELTSLVTDDGTSYSIEVVEGFYE